MGSGGYEGSSSMEAPAVVEKDPNERLQEVLDYLAMSSDPKSAWTGTSVFDIPAAPTNPRIIFWVRCDPKKKDQPVSTGFGMPPDGKYNVYTTMTRDDFFYLYSGRAGPGAVSSMCLTGRISVRWFRFHDLAAFASSFVYSTPQWIKYYRRYGPIIEAERLMLAQWQRAANDPSGSKIVDVDGNLIDAAGVQPEVVERLQSEGRRYLQQAAAEDVQALDAAAPVLAAAPADAEVGSPVTEGLGEKRDEGAPLVELPAAVAVEAGAMESSDSSGLEPVQAGQELLDEGKFIEPASAQLEPETEPLAEQAAAAVIEEGNSLSPSISQPDSEAGAYDVISEALATSTLAEVQGDDSIDTHGSTQPRVQIEAQADLPVGDTVEKDQAQVPISGPQGVEGDLLSGDGEAGPFSSEAQDGGVGAVSALAGMEAVIDSPPGSPASVPSSVSDAETQVDMLLLLPDLVAQTPVSAHACARAGLRVINTHAVQAQHLRTYSIAKALEPEFRRVESRSAEANVVEVALTQLESARRLLEPGSEDAKSALESVTSVLAGAVRSVADALTGDQSRRSAQLADVRRREATLRSRLEYLRSDIASKVEGMTSSLQSVQRASRVGAVLALVASGGFWSVDGQESFLSSQRSLCSQVRLQCVAPSLRTSLLAPLLGGAAWAPHAIAHVERQKVCVRRSVMGHAPLAALEGVSRLVMSLPQSQAPIGQCTGPPVLPLSVRSLLGGMLAGYASALQPNSTRGAGGAIDDSGRGSASGRGAGWAVANSDPDSALQARLAAVRQGIAFQDISAHEAAQSAGTEGGRASFPFNLSLPRIPDMPGMSMVVDLVDLLPSMPALPSLPSILDSAHAEGHAAGGQGEGADPSHGRATPWNNRMSNARDLDVSQPHTASEADAPTRADDEAFSLRLRALSASLASTHPLSSVLTHMHKSAQGVGGGRGSRPLWAPLMPAFVPSFLFDVHLQEAQVQGEGVPTLVSAAAAAVFRAMRDRGGRACAWVMDPAQAETAVWCMGASLVPFAKAPVTFGAVELSEQRNHSERAEEPGDSVMSLLPLWRPWRLVGASPRDKHREMGAGRGIGLGMQDVSTPWRVKSHAAPPTIYNGYGSGLYSSTAREMLRLQFEGAFASAAEVVAHAAAAAAGGGASATPTDPVTVNFGPRSARIKVQLRRGASASDEDSFAYGSDESMQAAGLTSSGFVEAFAPSSALLNLVRRVRDAKILKVYARSNPLSVYTADTGTEVGKHSGQPVLPVEGQSGSNPSAGGAVSPKQDD